MVQTLHLSNGETLNPKLAEKDNLIQKAIEKGDSNEQIIETIFLKALSRPPTDTERKGLSAVVAEYDEDRNTALQDVAWSVLTSTEFTFNH